MMATATWGEDRAALVALIELYDESFCAQTSADVARHLGIDTDDALRRMIRLSHADQPYAIFREESSIAAKDVYFVEPTERGYREVGQWPSVDSMREAFINQLAEAIKIESDAKKKSALERLLDAAQSVGTGVLNTVIGGAITSQLGIG